LKKSSMQKCPNKGKRGGPNRGALRESREGGKEGSGLSPPGKSKKTERVLREISGRGGGERGSVPHAVPFALTTKKRTQEVTGGVMGCGQKKLGSKTTGGKEKRGEKVKRERNDCWRQDGNTRKRGPCLKIGEINPEKPGEAVCFERGDPD